MNPSYLVPAVGVVCFVGGVVFSKALLSDAAAIKAHVTAEVDKIRSDFSTALANLKKGV
jgi:hypothetical protein